MKLYFLQNEFNEYYITASYSYTTSNIEEAKYTTKLSTARKNKTRLKNMFEKYWVENKLHLDDIPQVKIIECDVIIGMEVE